MTNNIKTSTGLVHSGPSPKTYNGLVNPPAHRASTIVFNTYADFQNCFNMPYRYGRERTPSTTAFEEAMAELDNAYCSIATSSGLAAINGALLSFLSAGDHALLPDNFYGFSRNFCEKTLKRFGIETTYYDPMIGADIESMVQDNTKILYLESPGSLTYEVQDIPAFVTVAKKHNLKTIMDNSWATPVHCKPLDLGIDVSVISATKYISGHSDAMLGVVSCKAEDDYLRIRDTLRQLGNCPGSEELYLGLRGLKTLGVRLKHHSESGLTLANWLSTRPEVKTILHPALPNNLGHDNFKKSFTGTSGAFAIVLHETNPTKIANMLDHMKWFKMGFSWGGYESLLFPEQLSDTRLTKPWDGDGFLMRIHAGLEDVEDLKNDLEAGLERLA